jgi:hypothetical protein
MPEEVALQAIKENRFSGARTESGRMFNISEYAVKINSAYDGERRAGVDTRFVPSAV